MVLARPRRALRPRCSRGWHVTGERTVASVAKTIALTRRRLEDGQETLSTCRLLADAEFLMELVRELAYTILQSCSPCGTDHEDAAEILGWCDCGYCQHVPDTAPHGSLRTRWSDAVTAEDRPGKDPGNADEP